MQNPKVTILMPVYNGALYIAEAIESVLAQTYSNFIFLIINDGSTDATQAIIDTYLDERIQSVKQENMGVAKSLNKGLGLINTPYILRHDADDKCLPDQLEKQVNFLTKNPKFSLVSTQIALMTDRGCIAHKFVQPKDNYFNGKDFIEVKKEQFNPYSPITHATVLIKTTTLKDLGGYRTEFLTSEDTDLWLRFLEKNKAAVMNYCSYFVRINATSATKKYENSTNYFRGLALDFANERADIGSDPIIRGEKITNVVIKNAEPKIKYASGKYYRGDLIGWDLKLVLNAKDIRNILNCLKIIVKDGWKLKETYKGILIALLGTSIATNIANFKKKVI